MNPEHTPLHPRWHRERMPIFWWLRKPTYVRFITRELTSLAVAYAALLLLVEVWVVVHGEEAYRRFLQVLQSPPVALLNVLVLAALFFHTVTWLGLAPKALVVRLRGRRVPDAALLAAHYLGWATVTAVLGWALLRP